MIRIISSGNGCAIYINTALSLKINDTTFYRCRSISGGAINLINGSNIQLFRICFVGSNGNNHYQSINVDSVEELDIFKY